MNSKTIKCNWICEYCNKSFRVRSELWSHYSSCEKKPKRKNWTCKYCNEIFTTCRKLKSHSDQCSCKPEKKLYEWKCSCGETFETRKKFKAHKKDTSHNFYRKCSQNSELRKCKYCNLEKVTTVSGIKIHERCCIENPCRVPVKGHPVSEKTKKHMSILMRRKHAEGTAPEWIRRQKRSYAEQYFYDILNKEFGNNVENNYIVGRFYLDFAWPKNKVYFEVDGEQHYRYQEMVEHDKIREEFLKENGWICLDRCRWSVYRKLNREQREKYIQELIGRIV